MSPSTECGGRCDGERSVESDDLEARIVKRKIGGGLGRMRKGKNRERRESDCPGGPVDQFSIHADFSLCAFGA